MTDNSNISPQYLRGKTALVTGSSRGIGRAIAQRFAAAGAHVVVTGRSLAAPTLEREGGVQPMTGTLAETVALIEAARGKAVAVAADLGNAGERASLVDRAREAAGAEIDILVNNAGVAENAPVEETSLELFEQTLDNYFRTPFILSKAAIPGMRRRGAGWIVNVGSVNGLSPRQPATWEQWTVYGSVKAALARFTQGLALELLDANIAVNLIAPSGGIATPGSIMYMKGSPGEDVAYLAETALALAHLPARERSGLLTHSLHFPTYLALDVYSLDGRDRLPPPVIPQTAHPGIVPSGYYYSVRASDGNVGSSGTS